MKTRAMALGAVMVDLAGPTLSEAERERLLHPQVAGVVLFTRNFESWQQLADLCEQIHRLRQPRLLIAVDHEGGRVQRFRQDGFTPLPPMARLGKLHDLNPMAADEAARALGWLMAAELLAVGVDFSFAPVVDLNHGRSQVIGERSFHGQAQTVAQLAGQWLAGMHEAGMAGVAKHFPGHGFAQADSHTDVAVDERDWEALQADLLPFQALIAQRVEGIMPAHVIYPAVDTRPAGFSPHWLQTILRQQMGFDGAIISDDLNMAAAKAVGNIVKRAELALAAGCDLLLALNDVAGADRLLYGLDYPIRPLSQARRIALHGRARFNVKNLRRQRQYALAQHYMEQLI
ncbi:MAG TPA: beta-N-acetylhexosaminidase [Sulfurivirga caldicuralii]|nr:beta-N-acetylhexosaminidase [Sulfurivirga caldicuralii]